MNSSFLQDWTLDPTGNWTEFLEDDDDDHEIWVLDQDRGHNEANEINSITKQTGEERVSWDHNLASPAVLASRAVNAASASSPGKNS